MRTHPEPSPVVLGVGWFPDCPGGLNRYLRDLLAALSRGGVPARAVVLGPVVDPSFRWTQVSRTDDSLPLRLWRFARAAGRAGAGATVVDAHFALYAFLPTVFGRLRHLPLVVHFQGPWADESASAGEERAWVLATKRRVEGAVYRRAREVVVLSAAFKRILVERYHVAPWRIHIMAPGVDLEHFRPGSKAGARVDLAIAEDAWVCLAVRRLVPRMGLDVLLRAWAALPSGGQDRMLLIAGDGPARRDLESLSRDLGIADTVRFLGGVSEEVLLASYRAADLCVVPSVALEGFGLVVLEALACGTPVVATDVGGLPEALRPLDDTLVVPAGDAPALAARLLGARDGPVPLPDGERCRTHAEGYSWEAAAAGTIQVYQQAVDPVTPSRLRVVYLDHFAGLSGGEIALLRLLPALEDVEAHVLLAHQGPLIGGLMQAGISVEVLAMADGARQLRREQVRPGRVPLRAFGDAVVYTGRLARRLRQLRPDIVHTNSLKSAIYGGLAGRIAGVPVVWHIRDRIAADYLPKPAVRLIRAMARLVPAAVICNSTSTLGTLPARTGPWRGTRRIPVQIQSPVPGIVMDPPFGNAGAGFCVGMVGRLAPWKGQHIFVAAFARAFPTGKGRHGEARAVIVGAPLFGEDAYERDVKELTVALGVDGRVAFVGFSEDVPGQLATFDVLVHASVVPEPFGLAVVEGMAAGLPVVATSAGGPGEVIEDGVNGVLYPSGDVDALAGKLRWLADDPDLRGRLGVAARVKAGEYAPEVIAQKVRAVYRDVLVGGGRP